MTKDINEIKALIDSIEKTALEAQSQDRWELNKVQINEALSNIIQESDPRKALNLALGAISKFEILEVESKNFRNKQRENIEALVSNLNLTGAEDEESQQFPEQVNRLKQYFKQYVLEIPKKDNDAEKAESADRALKTFEALFAETRKITAQDINLVDEARKHLEELPKPANDTPLEETELPIIQNTDSTNSVDSNTSALNPNIDLGPVHNLPQQTSDNPSEDKGLPAPDSSLDPTLTDNLTENKSDMPSENTEMPINQNTDAPSLDIDNSPPNLITNSDSLEKQKKTKMNSLKSLKKVNLTLVLLLGFILTTIISGIYTIKTKDQLNSLKGTPQVAGSQDNTDVVAKVGQLVMLPDGDTPTVATVTDPEKLKSQAFFANAQKDDKVLIFENSKKAILYRPSINKVIDIAPINVAGASTQNSSPSPTESPSPFPKRFSPIPSPSPITTPSPSP